jgi:phosphopantothenoylcysteine decarboxylase/phosphopantothenate--cysteine ligase
MTAMNILITAGPTREPIDPVRFISNYSTGKMGYAIAALAKKRGHKVVLVSGPTCLIPSKNVLTERVNTAQEMFRAVKRNLRSIDCVIMAAAVSDFRPAVYRRGKAKRREGIKSIALCKNPDILYWASRQAGKKMLVGFCMETKGLLQEAERKLKQKNLDIIVANKIDKKKKAFGEGRTSVVIMDKYGKRLRLSRVSKESIARILLDKVEELWDNKKLKI